MNDYLNMMKYLLTEGNRQFNERTGHLMIGRNKYDLTHDLREGFPALTTKKLFFESAAEELFWMLRGENNVRTLLDKNIHIWDMNAYDFHLKRNKLTDKIKKNTPEWNNGLKEFVERVKKDDEFAKIEGDMGLIYGIQWRHRQKRKGGEIDQLQNAINILKKDKGSRYAIIDAWNPEDLQDMALPPCHVWYQYSVWENKFLDLHMVQRSCDSYLGVPFNRVGPAIKAHLMAKELGLIPRELAHTLVNVHIYAGVSPRSEFLNNDSNLETFRNKVKESNKSEDYLQVREWYLNNAPPESPGNERKDHIPFILEQLSKTPLPLPELNIKSDLPLFELIERPALEVLELNNYQYHKWDSRAVMAA